MTSPLKIAARVEIDASQAPQGAATTRQAIASIGAEAERTDTKLQRLINSSIGFNSGAANQNVREWTGALASQGKSIDDLRAKYNPLFAVIREYKASQTEIRTLHAQGVLSLNEMTAAMQRNRQATLQSIDAIKGRNTALGSGAAHQNFAAANLAYQAQDVAVTAAMGMNPLMIGLQQGSQVAGSYSGMSLKEAASATAVGLTSLVSPVSIAAVGLTAAAAAAIQFGSGLVSAGDDAKKLDDALDRHEKVLKALEARYGSLTDRAKGYNVESSRVLQFQSGADIRGLKNATKLAGEDFFSTVGTQTRGGYQVNADWFGPGFEPFEKAVTALRNGMKAGRPDFEAFYDSIYRTAQLDPGYAKKADELAKLVTLYREGSRAVEEMERIERRLFDTVGPNGMLLSQGTANRDDMGNLALFESRRDVDARRRQQAFDAEIGSMGARSPQELGEAARRRAEAEYRDDEMPADRRDRIEKEATRARLQAEQQLKDAREDRTRALRSSVDAQQMELSLIGKTAGEVERLRTAYQLEAQLREEAARNHTKVDEQELALIRQKADELGKLAELRARTSLLSDAMFERDQLSRNPVDRQIAQQLRGAGLDVDMNSYEAGVLRANEALRQQISTWEDIRETGRDAIDEIVDSATEGFKDIDDVLKNIGKSILKDLTTLGITNPLKNALYGDTRPTLGSAGGVGGFFGALLGGGKPSAGFIANDNRAGGFSGLAKTGSVSAGGSAVDLASSLLGFTETGNNSDINAFLRKGGVDIDAARVKWCAGFVNSALDQIGVKGSGSLTANSFLDWGSKIDAGQVLRGDVLVQSRGLGANAAGAHVGFATGASRMFDNQLQLEMLSGNSGDSVAKSWINASELQIRRATEASTALAGMASNTNVAAQGLGNLGNGFNVFGNSLSQVQPGAGGSGDGLFGNLLGGIGKLFGGIAPTSPFWAPNTTLGAILTRADGGMIYGPGGPRDDRVPVLASNGEFFVNAASTAKHRALLEAINADRLPRFADGGYYGSGAPIYAAANRAYPAQDSKPVFQIINNTSVPMTGEIEESTDAGGRRTYRVIADEMVADGMSRSGGKTDRTMQGRFGVRRRGVKRS